VEWLGRALLLIAWLRVSWFGLAWLILQVVYAGQEPGFGLGCGLTGVGSALRLPLF
jgi:hypothetical protein